MLYEKNLFHNIKHVTRIHKPHNQIDVLIVFELNQKRGLEGPDLIRDCPILMQPLPTGRSVMEYHQYVTRIY